MTERRGFATPSRTRSEPGRRRRVRDARYDSAVQQRDQIQRP